MANRITQYCPVLTTLSNVPEPVALGPSPSPAFSVTAFSFIIGLSEVKNLESSTFHSVPYYLEKFGFKASLKPAATAIGTIATLQATLVGTGLGVLLAGPIAWLPSTGETPGLDNRLAELLQNLQWDEHQALMRHLNDFPEDWTIVKNAVNQTPEQQQRIVRILIEHPNTKVILELAPGVCPNSIICETQTTTQKDPQKLTNSCPPDMVYIPTGNYRGDNYAAICVDEHEYTDPGSILPRVDINLAEAEALCVAQNKRLPTWLEWVRIASKNSTKEYSTRSGMLDEGVHWNSTKPRKVCATRGKYIEYNGKEVCDMSGNVWEWTADGYVSGGSWNDGRNPMVLRVDYRSGFPRNKSLNDLGFRCVASP